MGYLGSSPFDKISNAINDSDNSYPNTYANSPNNLFYNIIILLWLS